MSNETPNELTWLEMPCAPFDQAAAAEAASRQLQLTKPAGALGRLESLAVTFAGYQRRLLPAVERVAVRVFAADHGCAAAGISAYPPAVTVQMMANFLAGGAAINVLSQLAGADFKLIDVGAGTELPPHADLTVARAGAGTRDARLEPAMTLAQLVVATAAGRAAVPQCDLFVGGEMGIGNSSVAAALAAALLRRPARDLVGPGTGVEGARLAAKLAAVEQMLARADTTAPLEALLELGGFEIAALSAAYISAAQRQIPSLVDGFIASVAALVAARINPGCRPWLIFAHHSAEPGHALVLQALEAEPLLALDLRLGEGSGAALAVPLVRAALALHREMATFAKAAVAREVSP